jgi:hypothetical protein
MLNYTSGEGRSGDFGSGRYHEAGHLSHVILFTLRSFALPFYVQPLRPWLELL